MIRRPLLCLNGKPMRYRQFYVRLCDIFNHFTIPSGFDPADSVEMRVNSFVVIDWQEYKDVTITEGYRLSGRRIIKVYTGGPDD